MAGPINSIFAAVTEKLATVAAYGDAATWCKLNATHLAEAAVPPRIVWVPIAEGYAPPQGQGGSGKNDPRPVATRLSAFEMHLWAADATQTGQANQDALNLDACEQLLNSFMWALYSVAHGSMDFIGSGRWSRGNVDGSLLNCGIAYILPVTFKIPVTRPAETKATITNIPTTVTTPNASVNFTITE